MVFRVIADINRHHLFYHQNQMVLTWRLEHTTSHWCHIPLSLGCWSKGEEVNPQAPPPFIDTWPNYASAKGSSSNKSKGKTIKGNGLLLWKKSSFN